MADLVVLVDERDQPLGAAAKQVVHETGALHRAFSVFVVDREGRMLLQRRAPDKYHSGGLWTNTCCSHPRPGEDVEAAAHRRLREEMGFDCPLVPAGSFVYRAELGNGLIEHELDHLFVGRFDGAPTPDRAEVAEWRWVLPRDAAQGVAARPEEYTAWFRLALPRLPAGSLQPGP